MKEKKLKLITDHRAELISILHYFSNFQKMKNITTLEDNEYTKNVNSWFLDWINHDVIKFSDYLAEEKCFGFDGPYTMILHYELNTILKKKNEFHEEILSRIDLPEIERFICYLNKFITDTNFLEFIKSSNRYYEELTNNYKSNLSEFNIIKIMEDYFGKIKSTPEIILAPLNAGSYSAKVINNNKLPSVFSIIGMDGRIKINSQRVIYIDSISWHEFSHSVINPLGDKYSNQIYKMKNLFESISEKMASGYNAYGEWLICLNEHIVRAVTSRLIKRYYGEETSQRLIDWDKKQGFIYIDIINEELENYESRRDYYKTFDDFYPNILNRLSEL